MAEQTKLRALFASIGVTLGADGHMPADGRAKIDAATHLTPQHRMFLATYAVGLFRPLPTGGPNSPTDAEAEAVGLPSRLDMLRAVISGEATGMVGVILRGPGAPPALLPRGAQPAMPATT